MAPSRIWMNDLLIENQDTELLFACVCRWEPILVLSLSIFKTGSCTTFEAPIYSTHFWVYLRRMWGTCSKLRCNFAPDVLLMYASSKYICVRLMSLLNICLPSSMLFLRIGIHWISGPPHPPPNYKVNAKLVTSLQEHVVSCHVFCLLRFCVFAPTCVFLPLSLQFVCFANFAWSLVLWICPTPNMHDLFRLFNSSSSLFSFYKCISFLWIQVPPYVGWFLAETCAESSKIYPRTVHDVYVYICTVFMYWHGFQRFQKRVWIWYRDCPYYYLAGEIVKYHNSHRWYQNVTRQTALGK